jgi:hypothetical protein
MQATLEDGQQILHITNFVQNVLDVLIAIFCLYGEKFTNCGKLWSSIGFYSFLSNGFLGRSNWKLRAICLYRLRNFRR